jgi:hypothetical protein
MSDNLLIVQRDVNSPPGGWKYTVPQTGVTITSPFYASLLPRVIRHLKANGIPITDELLEVIEDGACRESNVGSWCCPKPEKPVADMPVPLLSAMESFIRCIWAAVLARKFVPREEVERRIAVCMICPLRSEAPSGCSGCYTLLRKAKDLLSGKSAITIEPDADGVVRDTCKACLCVLPLKATMTSSTLDKCEGERRPPYAEGCWRLEK